MDELDELLQEDERFKMKTLNNDQNRQLNQQQVLMSLDLDSDQQITMNTLIPHEGEACNTMAISSSWLDFGDDVYTPVLPEQLQDLCRILDEPVEEEEVLQDLHYPDDEDAALMLNFAPNPSLDNDIADAFPPSESPFLVDDLLYNIDDLHVHHTLNQSQPQESIDEETYPLLSEQINFDVPAVGQCDLTFLDEQLSTASNDNVNHGQHNNIHDEDIRAVPVPEDHNNVPSLTVNNSEEVMESVVVAATNEAIELEVHPPNCEQGNAESDQTPGNNTDDNGEEYSNKQQELQASGATSTSACKNLVSERNRRKRLSEQLLALRALVPNITKMDKRSVLVDALGYLRSIHEETAKLENELKHQSSSTITTTTQANSSAGYNAESNLSEDPPNIPRISARGRPSTAASKSNIVTITEIDTEEIEDRRFVVKITCKISSTTGGLSSSRVGADVLRVMESLGFEITYTSNTTTTTKVARNQSPRSTEQVLVVLTTLFIKVRNKHGIMTEETLRDCITNRALRSGLTLQTNNP